MANPSERAAFDLPLPTGEGQPRSNGHGNGSRPVPGAAAPGDRAGGGRPPGPSAKPALVVFAIVFVVFLAGFLADLLSGGARTSAPPRPAAATPVPGTGGLVPEPARAVLAAVVTADQPPADVLDALVVPKGTRFVPGSAAQRGLGLYDASVRVEIDASEQDAITFFRAELAGGNWHLLSAGRASGGGYQLIAQHPGSDGYEWEVGETISPTAFSSQIPGGSAPAAGVTPATLRLFAVSDQG